MVDICWARAYGSTPEIETCFCVGAIVGVLKMLFGWNMTLEGAELGSVARGIGGDSDAGRSVASKEVRA